MSIPHIKKPRILIMGDSGMEVVPWDSIPEPEAAHLEDYFKPVRISPRAIDIATKIIPAKYYAEVGLHTFLAGRANKVFRLMSASQTAGQYGKVKYFFEFDAHGPVLKTVSL